MIVSCHLCGRPVCEIEPPEFKSAEVGIVRRTLSGFGLELPELAAVLNPTPEGVSTFFKVQCHGRCGGR